jgi:3-dehydroquinate dehydratase
MTIINREGQPLPEGHPFSGTRIIFGMKRPDSFGKKSKKEVSSSPQPKDENHEEDVKILQENLQKK